MATCIICDLLTEKGKYCPKHQLQHEIGIDYGSGCSNRDTETGIRYGVINIHSVDPHWLDDFEPQYADPHCPYCGDQLTQSDDTEHCEHCGNDLNGEDLTGDPISWTYDADGIQAEYSADSSWIFVFRSPHIVTCKHCSPCVPGAGDLDNQHPNGIRTYGLTEEYLYKEE